MWNDFPQLSWVYADEETLRLTLTHYVSVFVPKRVRAGGRNDLFLWKRLIQTKATLHPCQVCACVCTSCFTWRYTNDRCDKGSQSNRCDGATQDTTVVNSYSWVLFPISVVHFFLQVQFFKERYLRFWVKTVIVCHIESKVSYSCASGIFLSCATLKRTEETVS